MIPFVPSAVISEFQYADTADVVDTNPVTIAAARVGARNCLMAIQVTNTDIAVGTVVQILDGSTVIGNIFVGPFVAAAPGDAFAQATFPKPLKCSENTALRFQCVTTSAQVRISAQGYTATA